jgi:hypothetical protein
MIQFGRTMGQFPHITSETTASLSILELIEYHLDNNPEHAFARFPAADPDAEPDVVTYLEFARAAQRVACAVCPDGGAPVKQGAVVGIIANADNLLYMALIGGLMRAGLTVRSTLVGLP